MSPRAFAVIAGTAGAAQRKPCAGPDCRQSVQGRHRFCRWHWRQLPAALRQAMAEAFAGQAWHVVAELGLRGSEWLRSQHEARVAESRAVTARICGETE